MSCHSHILLLSHDGRYIQQNNQTIENEWMNEFPTKNSCSFPTTDGIKKERVIANMTLLKQQTTPPKNVLYATVCWFVVTFQMEPACTVSFSCFSVFER